jgi:hypothetical protein
MNRDLLVPKFCLHKVNLYRYAEVDTLRDENATLRERVRRAECAVDTKI